MRTNDPLDGLLRGLPNGQAQYMRDHDTGTWSVGIYAPGSVHLLATIATSMDKSVACWLMSKLNRALNRIHQ